MLNLKNPYFGKKSKFLVSVSINLLHLLQMKSLLKKGFKTFVFKQMGKGKKVMFEDKEGEEVAEEGKKEKTWGICIESRKGNLPAGRNI